MFIYAYDVIWHVTHLTDRQVLRCVQDGTPLQKKSKKECEKVLEEVKIKAKKAGAKIQADTQRDVMQQHHNTAGEYQIRQSLYI